MSSTNKTTNYELSQFVETDKPAWLTDYNGDMRKLDTALKAVSDVADGASGGISSLTDRMTAAEGAITTNANDIDALEARADNLEAQAQSTAGTIAGIQTEQTAQNLGIEAATELGYNLARPYDSASTYAVGAYVLFQNTLYKCITAVATGEAFDPTKWLAIKATDEISAGGYTLPIASTSQLGGVKVGDGLSIDPVTGLLSASGGGGVEITPLTTENFPLPSIDSLRLTDITMANNTGTQITSYTNKRLTFINERSRFYAKIGNMRILKFSMYCTCQPPYTLQPGHAMTMTPIEIDIPSFIDPPSAREYSYNLSYGMGLNLSNIIYQSTASLLPISIANRKLMIDFNVIIPANVSQGIEFTTFFGNYSFIYYV